MKALTVRQPWADAIAHGTKRVENRTWRTGCRGLVLIHAGASEDHTARLSRDVPLELTENIGTWPDVRGAVIAIARITNCHMCDGSCSPWAEHGVWHWTLTSVQPLAEPVPCRGRLQLWTPPEDVVTAVLEQERERMIRQDAGGAR